MPTEDWHQFKFKHDYEASRVFKNKAKGFPDGEVITLFYSALHLMDIQLAKVAGGGLHPTTHAERRKLVSSNITPVAASYQALYLMSRKARYEGTKTSDTESKTAEAKFEQMAKVLAK